MEVMAQTAQTNTAQSGHTLKCQLFHDSTPPSIEKPVRF